jgi:hypothetical protein
MHLRRPATAGRALNGFHPNHRAWRLLGAILFAMLIGWLLMLNTAGGDTAPQPYRPFTPQDAARQCAIEAGITANQPGQRIPAEQLNRLGTCMDREIARAGAQR